MRPMLRIAGIVLVGCAPASLAAQQAATPSVRAGGQSGGTATTPGGGGPVSPGGLGGEQRLTPVRPLYSLLTSDDYPMRALRNEEQGRVAIRMTVDPAGAITRCVVTSSSGSATLDDATCAIAQRRLRFLPTERGGVAEQIVVWALPD